MKINMKTVKAMTLIAVFSISIVLFIHNAFAQLDNSISIDEQESTELTVIDGIYGLILLTAFIISVIRVKNPKTKIRGGIAFFLVLVSGGIWLFYPSFYQSTSEVDRQVFPILIAITAIIVGSRTRKSIRWKKYKGIRRQFSGQVRQVVLNAQKNKCTNCNMSISVPLVHYDHIDGNHSNNDISNCQALCPNCHSLKTDDDRRNQ